MWRRSRVVVLAIGVLTLIGCASTVQDWVKPGAARVTRVAVLPLENQTSSLRARCRRTTGWPAAVLAAMKHLIADGTYLTILKKWGVDAGAISNPVINGAQS